MLHPPEVKRRASF